MNAAQLGFWAILLAGAVRLATPITLAALGETLVERCGIVNLGVEGMMALGAFMGVWGASQQSWAVGLILGGAAGGIPRLADGIGGAQGRRESNRRWNRDYVAGYWARRLFLPDLAALGPIRRSCAARSDPSVAAARPAAIDWRGAVRAKPTELFSRSSPSSPQAGRCGGRRRDYVCVPSATIPKPRSCAALMSCGYASRHWS